MISRLNQGEFNFLKPPLITSVMVIAYLAQLISQKLSKKVQNTYFPVFVLFPSIFFHVSLKINFNLLPKSTFNFMEGRKLCTAFVSWFHVHICVTMLKTCFEKKKLATRDYEPRFGNESIGKPTVSEIPKCSIWQRFPFLSLPSSPSSKESTIIVKMYCFDNFRSESLFITRRNRNASCFYICR